MAVISNSADAPAAGPAPGRRHRHGEGWSAFWLILPTLVVLGVVIAYPVLRAMYRSLFSDPIGLAPKFIGLHNYVKAIYGGGADTSRFWDALRVTLFFTVVTVILEVIIGFIMALVMYRAFRGRGLVRTAILIPWAIPTAVCAVLWRWTFDANGIVNHLLGKQFLWTGAEWPAKTAIIFADTWKTAPFIALLTLAGLQAIPTELYEAARVDGAGAWKRLTTITLPLVRPALIVAVLFRMLDVLRMYDLPQIFTNGANDTTTLSILVVRESINNLKAGYGSALSTITFLFIFLCAWLFIKSLGAQVLPAGGKGTR